MTRKYSAIRGIAFFISVFVTIIAIEAMALTVFEMLFKTNLMPPGPARIVLPISVALTGWVLALGVYIFYWAPMDRVDKSTLDNTQASVQTEPRYMPSETAYINVLLALVALSVVDGDINEEKLIWIETFHTQWIKIGQGSFYQLIGRKIDRDVLVAIARDFTQNGPRRIVDTLLKNKKKMKIRDREILIKLCFLLATIDGPISIKETTLIIDIASAIEISKERMLEL